MTGLRPWVQHKALNIVPTVSDDGTPDGFYRRTGGLGQGLGADGFEEVVSQMYRDNGIVFACVGARAMPFSEARFQLQDISSGRPGQLFDDPSLRLLDTPWPNGTTGELLFRMEQDVSLGGNFFATVRGTGASRRIRRMRPDWVTIISGVRGSTDRFNVDALDAEVLGYIYEPPGREMMWLDPDVVVHYSPLPDPLHHWRGMSWITPLIREIEADSKATKHKLKYFDNGAALSTVIRYPAELEPAKFRRYVELFEEAHRGPDNAYKTLHIGGGADPTVIGSEMKTDFRSIQAAGENRVAAAAGVGAVMARFTDGLSGSSLNEGNYKAAKRQFADMTLRPLWRGAAGALSKLCDVPDGARLWYDVRDVELLKENEADEASIVKVRSESINSLVTAGYTPESVIAAVEAGDLSILEHSGLYSVQLQPLSTGDANDPDAEPKVAPEDLAAMLQKLYLAVDVVITPEEARELMNRAGADLTGAAPKPGGTP